MCMQYTIAESVSHGIPCSVFRIREIWSDICIDLLRQVCSGFLVHSTICSGPNDWCFNQRPRQQWLLISGAGLGCGLVGLCYSQVGVIITQVVRGAQCKNSIRQDCSNWMTNCRLGTCYPHGKYLGEILKE
jgi:hypothetical protein